MGKKKPWKPSNNITGIRTGYKVIDYLFGGLCPGEVTLIAGKPMMGKKTLALNIAINASLKEKKKVAYYEVCRGFDYAEKWYLSYLSEIPVWDIDKWNFSPDEWKRFIHATEVYRELGLTARGTIELECIIEGCEKLAKEEKVDLIVIDYLQVIEKHNKKTVSSPDSVLIELNALAKRLKVPIIVVTVLRGKTTRRIDKRPCAKDLKLMGISEEYWENALLLHREEEYGYKGTEKVEIVATKSFTDIEINTCLYFNLDNLHFEDIDTDEIRNHSDNVVFIDEQEFEEDENWLSEDEIVFKMKESLEENLDEAALRYANELRKLNYYAYSGEIEECYKICAARGNISALLYMENKYRRNGKVCAEEFDVLKKLTDLGYTRSFDRIGDCYLNGVGCETDREKALIDYINGCIYWDDEYCNEMIEEHFKNEKEWEKLSPKITDLFLYDWTESERAKLRLANAIFDGKIKEYKSDVAYYIYKNFYYFDSFYHETEAEYCSIPCLNLAKCLLYGIGTAEKPEVALAVLKEAMNLSEWERNAGDLTAFDRIEEIEKMMKEIEETFGKIEPDYSDDFFDIDYEEDDFLGNIKVKEEDFSV